MNTTETPPRTKRRLRYFLITLAAFAVTIGIFYGEEDWRGWEALQQCQRELRAEGASLDWKSYIPAPVPDDQNVFGMPEMQAGFTGRGARQILPKKTPPFPAWNTKDHMVLAELTFALNGDTPPPGCSVVQWGDPDAKLEITQLIKRAVGPVALDPRGYFYTKQPSEDVRPARIFVPCQAQPGQKDLEKFPPKTIFNDYINVKLEQTGPSSFELTVPAPGTAADFLAWSQEYQQEDDLVQNALQRPYSRIKGDYSEPSLGPIPNFVQVRTISQRLAAMAECHLLLRQPEQALSNLTFIHDICRRILEENEPMTLISAMINVAVRGLSAGVIADGLEIHAWQEAQLAALEEQLKPINLLVPVQKAWGLEQFGLYYHLTHESPAEYFKLFDYERTRHQQLNWKDREQQILIALIPQGWACENALAGTRYYTNVIAAYDPSNRLMFPARVANLNLERTFQSQFIFPHWLPSFFMAVRDIPNFVRATQTTARNQTMLNQALIACALERYRLAHGEYPEGLDVLIPQYLDAIPHDVIGGQPPHYRGNDDGTFLLYSIGWDEKDHGGHAGPDSYTGDFVWPEK